MATVLPKSPPGYSANNIDGTVKATTDYLYYLHENMDYLLGQLQKKDLSMSESISAMQTTLSAVQNAIQSIQGDIATIKNNYTALEARVSALENAT